MIREIVFYKDHFLEFYEKLGDKAQTKVEYVFDLIRYESRVPTRFLKHIKGTEKLYEIRVKSMNRIYRIFCFFDEGKCVVVLTGFEKKTQKTPRNEIIRAEKLRKEYYDEQE